MNIPRNESRRVIGRILGSDNLSNHTLFNSIIYIIVVIKKQLIRPAIPTFITVIIWVLRKWSLNHHKIFLHIVFSIIGMELAQHTFVKNSHDDNTYCAAPIHHNDVVNIWPHLHRFSERINWIGNKYYVFNLVYIWKYPTLSLIETKPSNTI